MSKSEEPFLATMTRLSQLQKGQYLDPNGRKGSEHAPSKAATHGKTFQGMVSFNRKNFNSMHPFFK
jgi:hypothetical protein